MFISRMFFRHTTLTVTIKADRDKTGEGPLSEKLTAAVNKFEAELKEAGFDSIIDQS